MSTWLGPRLVVEFTLEQQKMLDLRALEVAYRVYDKEHPDKLARHRVVCHAPLSFVDLALTYARLETGLMPVLEF